MDFEVEDQPLQVHWQLVKVVGHHVPTTNCRISMFSCVSNKKTPEINKKKESSKKKPNKKNKKKAKNKILNLYINDN